MTNKRGYFAISVTLYVAFAALGCGEASNAPSGAGGSAQFGSGGAAASTGGAAIGAAGGESAVGGSPVLSGGIGAAGGAASAGGGSAAGGAGETGGNLTGAGGMEATGGSVSAIESEGCGMPSPAPCDTAGSPCTIEANGREREYYVVLPAEYDANRAYPVVFQFHPLGGNAEQGMNMYNFRSNLPEAIYVTPDGLTSGQFQGWSNTDGEDEELTRNIVAAIETQYCIDKSRYFSGGFSFGGSMSYTAALCMDDIFRAVGIMAGAPISGAGSCEPEHPVAAWINHGTADEALPITMSTPLRDELVAKNGCDGTSRPVEPAPCVAYDNCANGYPVIWCEQADVGHAIPSYGAKAITDFFKQF